MSRPVRPARAQYPAYTQISTRWSDNDIYGHVNNSVYYFWFDTAVNEYLIKAGALDIRPVEAKALADNILSFMREHKLQPAMEAVPTPNV